MLYKDIINDKVLPLTLRGTYDVQKTEYELVEEGEELEDGTFKEPVYEAKTVTETVEFECHENPEITHLNKNWFLDILINGETVKSENDITFKQIRLSKEQRERLENPIVQSLDESQLGPAKYFVKHGLFASYIDPETDEFFELKHHPLLSIKKDNEIFESTTAMLKYYEDVVTLNGEVLTLYESKSELEGQILTVTDTLLSTYEEKSKLEEQSMETFNALLDAHETNAQLEQEKLALMDELLKSYEDKGDK